MAARGASDVVRRFAACGETLVLLPRLGLAAHAIEHAGVVESHIVGIRPPLEGRPQFHECGLRVAFGEKECTCCRVRIRALRLERERTLNLDPGVIQAARAQQDASQADAEPAVVRSNLDGGAKIGRGFSSPSARSMWPSRDRHTAMK